VSDVVNLHSRPDANSLVVARVGEGAVLKRSGGPEHGWYRVVPPEGVFSYVAAQYVARSGENEGVVAVRSGTLRVRVGSLVQAVDPWKSETQARLPPGATVTVVGQQGEWLKIVPPPEVGLYVAAEHVVPISASLAAELQAVASRPMAAAVTTAPAPSTRPAVGPDLSGPWGQRLVLVEAAIAAESGKPLGEQSWATLIGRLQPIAAQREEPAVARLATAWIDQLQRRAAELEVLRDADEIRRRMARDAAQHERELERIAQVRQALTRPAYDARGELLESWVLARDERRWYKLLDPLTGQVQAYLEIDAEVRVDPEKFLGQYVGVRGQRRPQPELGADVVRPVEIVVLRPETAASQPASQPARQQR